MNQVEDQEENPIEVMSLLKEWERDIKELEKEAKKIEKWDRIEKLVSGFAIGVILTIVCIVVTLWIKGVILL